MYYDGAIRVRPKKKLIALRINLNNLSKHKQNIDVINVYLVETHTVDGYML
jgi:hypothetical protein